MRRTWLQAALGFLDLRSSCFPRRKLTVLGKFQEGRRLALVAILSTSAALSSRIGVGGASPWFAWDAVLLTDYDLAPENGGKAHPFQICVSNSVY
jgi:hypothetical protein